MRIFPAAEAYFESAKKAQAAEGEVGVKKTKAAMNLKKLGEKLQKGAGEAATATSDAIARLTSDMSRNQDALLAIELAKSAAAQQLADVRLAMLMEGDQRKQFLDALAGERLARLNSAPSQESPPGVLPTAK